MTTIKLKLKKTFKDFSLTGISAPFISGKAGDIVKTENNDTVKAGIERGIKHGLFDIHVEKAKKTAPKNKAMKAPLENK